VDCVLFDPEWNLENWLQVYAAIEIWFVSFRVIIAWSLVVSTAKPGTQEGRYSTCTSDMFKSALIEFYIEPIEP